jgi:hypothetical protein
VALAPLVHDFGRRAHGLDHARSGRSIGGVEDLAHGLRDALDVGARSGASDPSRCR